MATDPVCGMFVDERTADLTLVRGNRTFYFCSTGCLRQFAEPERELTRLGIRLAVAWPLSLGIVALTYFVRSPDGPWVAFGLASVVQFFPGLAFYRGLLDAVRTRTWNMDVLIAVGTTSAYAFSGAAVFDRSLAPSLYFDASSLIIALILTGNYLEYFVREKARGTLRRLDEVRPTTAVVLRAGRATPVPANEMKVGDLVRVLPGERFPADGTIRDGRSSVNEALLTGESLPVPKHVGDTVLTGAVNGEGPLIVDVTRIGSDTFLAEVGRLLIEAESSRVPIRRFADRLAARFVPIVLGLAVGAALAWLLLGAVAGAVALLVFVSVVITACPCAFGIATPAALLVGTGRAAEEGILFKGGATLEAASSVSVVFTDKTGTLTRGAPALTDIVPAEGVSAAELLSLVGGVESGSEHPLARAVVDAALGAGVAIATVANIEVEPGRGVRGERSGRPVAVRSGSSATGAGWASTPLAEAARALAGQGKSWSLVTDGGRPLGVLGFADPIANGVSAAIRALQHDGIEVVMLTGDHEAAARAVAERLGIGEVYAGLRPDGKLRAIRDRQARGAKVAYVGDGINDAPALAQADVGIAIGAGTDVAREASGIILVRSDFRDVALALRLGRRTLRKVRGNLAWAVGYNAILLPIAAGALVPLFGLGIFRLLPIAGATAMALSSSLVVANSYSLRWVSLGRAPEAGPSLAPDL